MKYRGGARGVNDACWNSSFLGPCRETLAGDPQYANRRDKAKYDPQRRFHSSMVSVVRTWISKQRSQASNTIGIHQAACSNPRKPTTTGAAGGTPEGPPSRGATPIKAKGKRARLSELRDLAFARSHMVNKVGNRESLDVLTLPPRVPTSSVAITGDHS